MRLEDEEGEVDGRRTRRVGLRRLLRRLRLLRLRLERRLLLVEDRSLPRLSLSVLLLSLLLLNGLRLLERLCDLLRRESTLDLLSLLSSVSLLRPSL